MPRPASSLDDFDLASGAGNLLLRRLAEGVRPHCERDLQFTGTQNLYARALCAHDAQPGQRLGCNRVARRENVKALDVFRRERLGERTRESELGQTPVKRHLAAFKPGWPRIAAAGLLPLVVRAGGLTHFRAHTASHANLAVTRAPRRLQIR